MTESNRDANVGDGDGGGEPDRDGGGDREASVGEGDPVAGVILQGGRAKAYRPLPEAARRDALEAGLAAYGRGDYFLAHELLEPAWMGTEDVPERELLQGVIKLAAAYVHRARGNPAGLAKNLRGALARIEAGRPAGAQLGIDADALATDVAFRLAAVENESGEVPLSGPPVIRRTGGSEAGEG